ncbi:MAG: DUF3352 domain-containing protein [Microcoleaceae cyanobacterium MO_207.B10]|nr:DUF3352 domain-containing protein [Microcoleaceae cyanobacterium MO_207.B10]
MIKLRSDVSFFTVCLLLLVMLTLGGCSWLTNSKIESFVETATEQKASIFVSRDTPLMASLLINPNSLEKLVGPKKFNQLKNTLLGNSDIDYRREIKPWVGDEVTFAVTTPDIDRDSSNGQQTGILLAVATKDAELTTEILELFWQKRGVAGENLAFESYQGVKLIYSQTQESISLATAVVGDEFVLFANHPKVLRDAINNVQVPKLNINGNPNFQKAFANSQEGRIGLVFANIPQIFDSTGMKQPTLPLLEETTAETPRLNSLQDLATILKVTRGEGLVAENTLIFADKIPATSPTLSEPVAALKFIPVASSFVAASTDLNNFWQQFSTLISDNTIVSNLVNQSVKKLATNWGIDLPEDIFSWVKGEYAVALLPNPEQLQPDLIFVVKKSPEVTEAIAHLDEIATAQDDSLGAFTLDNQKIYAWTQLTSNFVGKGKTGIDDTIIKAEVKGVHANVGKYEIFTTSVEAMDEALKAAEKSNFLERNDFQESVAVLPQFNDGYLFLDLPELQQFLEGEIPFLRLIELSGKVLFEDLRSLTLTNIGSEVGVRRANVFLRFN